MLSNKTAAKLWLDRDDMKKKCGLQMDHRLLVPHKLNHKQEQRGRTESGYKATSFYMKVIFCNNLKNVTAVFINIQHSHC